jgi:glycosyltransferase involved in cell wall biosynthesis
MCPPTAPLVSVLMSVYNEAPDFFDKAMSSVLHQTFQDFEVIVIDDGSDSPGTIEAIGRWEKADPRLRVIRQANHGLTKSLNLGITAARGQWIARHDSDDWSDPQRLEQQLALSTHDPEIGLIGSWFYIVDKDGRILNLHQMLSSDEQLRKSVAKKNPFCHGAMMFRRDHALEIGGYREFLHAAQDYDFFWRLIDLKCKFGAVEEPLYYLRNNPNSISGTRAYLQKEAAWILRRLAERRRNGLDEMSVLSETLSMAKSAPLQREFYYTGSLLAAHKVFESGLHRTGLTMILKALLTRPFSPLAYEYLARKLGKILLRLISISKSHNVL